MPSGSGLASVLSQIAPAGCGRESECAQRAREPSRPMSDETSRARKGEGSTLKRAGDFLQRGELTFGDRDRPGEKGCEHPRAGVEHLPQDDPAVLDEYSIQLPGAGIEVPHMMDRLGYPHDGNGRCADRYLLSPPSNDAHRRVGLHLGLLAHPGRRFDGDDRLIKSFSGLVRDPASSDPANR